MRPIDAENIKTVICDITNDAIEKNQTKATIQKRLILAIEKIPTLDVKPVIKGKWNYDPSNKFICNQCGGYSDLPKNFCHDCGAYMRESEE